MYLPEETQPEAGGLTDPGEFDSSSEYDQLLDRFHDGDHSVLPLLWKGWGPSIIRKAKNRFLRHGVDYTTSDLGQSVICALLMQADRGRSFGDCPPAFRAYVAATAMNRARYRQRQRDRRLDANDLTPRSGEIDPAERLAVRQEFERTQSRMAVMKRPETVRLLGEETPVAVIAERQGGTKAAVKNQVLRDRRRLQEALDERHDATRVTDGTAAHDE